jgi:RimJ/RimL family protein N-acetyltransferase
MVEQPNLRTERLLLRTPVSDDVPVIQNLLQERDIAATTLNIPHPYPEGAAAEWLAGSYQRIEEGLVAVFGMVRQTDLCYMGTVSLHLDPEHSAAELGYWIGKPYWNNGYTTEAVRRVIQYGFEEMDLHRIAACYYTHNPASGRVMQKANMQFEGTLRQHTLKWGQFCDLGYYSILATD